MMLRGQKEDTKNDPNHLKCKLKQTEVGPRFKNRDSYLRIGMPSGLVHKATIRPLSVTEKSMRSYSGE